MGRENRAEIRLSEATKGVLTLTDATGRTIWTRKAQLPAGISTHVLETDASGVYVLTLSTDKGTVYRKFSVF
jgi:outer membrane protein assembly factor BamB